MIRRVWLEKRMLYMAELLHRQDTLKDAKALEDIAIIDDLLVKKGDSKYNPLAEDDRVRREYPVIGLLEIWNKNRICRESRQEYDFLNQLENDKFGIFVDVLLRHGMIKDYKEMIIA